MLTLLKVGKWKVLNNLSVPCTPRWLGAGWRVEIYMYVTASLGLRDTVLRHDDKSRVYLLGTQNSLVRGGGVVVGYVNMAMGCGYMT